MTMFKEIKKRATRNAILTLIFCIVAGGFLFVCFGKDALTYLKGATDITEASVAKIKDTDYAEITLDKYNLYGCYSEQYSKSGSSQTVSDYYYLVVVGDDNDMRFMGVKVKAKNRSKLKKIEEEYTAMDNGEDTGTTTTLKIKGKLTKMESKPYVHFKQTISQSYDFSYSELDSVTLNLMVVDGTVNVGELVFCLAGVVIILVGIITMIIAASGVTVNKFKNELESRGPGYIDYVEQDFINAVKFTKTVRIGREFTFLIKGTKCVMIPNNEIVWAYPVKTTHRTNGIKTGSTHSVKLLNNRKKEFILPADNADQANDIIDLYANMTDTIVLGYDDGLNGLFARNFDEFLNIAYKNHIYGDKNNQYANDNYNNYDNGNYDNVNNGNNNYDNVNNYNNNYDNANNGNNNYDNTNNTTI